MAHAAEWGHWYDADGKPAYEVPYADPSKGTRPTTLADAKKLGLRPSVTTIINEAAKPGLERWKQEQVLHAALTLPRIEGEPENEYLARIIRDSQEQSKKAAERGTAIHAAIQGAYEGKSVAPEFYNHVGQAEGAIATWAKDEKWVAEDSFSHNAGYGGKVDLHSTLCSHVPFVADFKTTEKPLESLNTYDSHWMQLAAYREGLMMPTARCAIVYVHALEPAARLIEIPEINLQRGWRMFRALLDYWYARTGMKR